MAPNPNASNPAFYHVQGWVKGIRHQLPDAGHWNVLQIKHMKNFKESRVFHEFLIVKVQRGDDASTTVELIVERKRELDQVVVGWNSKVAKDDYSRADVLSVLEFKETPPLLLLADVVLQTHKNYPSYHLFVANCFYFAHTVYKALQLQFANTEVNTQYHEYKGKFAGVRWVKEHHAKPVRIVPDGPEVTFSEDDEELLTRIGQGTQELFDRIMQSPSGELDLATYNEVKKSQDPNNKPAPVEGRSPFTNDLNANLDNHPGITDEEAERIAEIIVGNVVRHARDLQLERCLSANPTGKIFVRNQSGGPIDCRVTAYGGGRTDDDWFRLPASFNFEQPISRQGWELIIFRTPSGSQKVGFYQNIGVSSAAIIFHDFDEVEFKRPPGVQVEQVGEIVKHRDDTAASDVLKRGGWGEVYVRNLSDRQIYCSVSNFNGKGGDEWKLLPNSTSFVEPWKRDGYELVRFKDDKDPGRQVGFYHDTHERATVITLYSFDDVEVRSGRWRYESSNDYWPVWTLTYA